MAMFILGIDVSKLTLDASVLTPATGRIRTHAKVSNDAEGITALSEWAQLVSGAEPPDIRVIMEATGRYHETTAEVLHALKHPVVVAAPFKVKQYGKSIGQRNKTDRADSRLLAQYGEVRKLHFWEPPPPEIDALRDLVRRLSTLNRDAKREKTRIQQVRPGRTPQAVIDSIKESLVYADSMQDRMKAAIDAYYEQHSALKRKRSLLRTIPGVGEWCADHLLVRILDRTFTDARDVAALIGLTPIHTQSGTSVHAPAHLPVEGDRVCSSVLYMSAMCAIRPGRVSGAPINPELQQIYKKLCAKGKRPRQALVAVMRHIVHIAVGILRNDVPYVAALVSNVNQEQRAEIIERARQAERDKIAAIKPKRKAKRAQKITATVLDEAA